MPTNKQLTKQFQLSVNRLKTLRSAHVNFNIFTSYRHPTKLSLELEAQYSELSSAEVLSPLAGKLCAIKDNIATTEEPTTCSSRALSRYVSPYNATVTSLLYAAGASVVGKTNMDEFGMGAATTHSYYGVTRNPQDPERIIGGSSGGSAAAVAAGICDFALGTDTGGSVRNPATHGGIVGLKPSYGRVSRWGVIPYAQSFDTVGVLASNVATARDVYMVLDKYDTKDPTCLDNNMRETILTFVGKRSGKLVIGIPLEFNIAELVPEIRDVWASVLIKLHEKGYTIKQVSIPAVKQSLPTYYTLALAEAASNLAKYDGIRYGYRDAETDIEKEGSEKTMFAETRSAQFNPEVKQRILLGNYNLSSDGYKNNFLKALQLRKQLTDEFNKVFRLNNALATVEGNPQGVDVLISPTQSEETPKLHIYELQLKESPVYGYINDVLTVPGSLSGLPCISVPVGGKDMPLGIQVMGQFGDDVAVLEMGEEVMNLSL
ncbi:hypothetical protein BABINDRAFT_160784 [Babjeviella inositovora NRRL Y-12698]|uniref:Glutamyl-tRNA(Gln) amidotransferase subunit A, mitochondrial n=1 Tax=Babjeviella inositovora NRRL Y-12698 TaxID=984486 RepID=A0A1E3QS52_9ASCO|nr:uncharacterized protein BABINDRAFT_160784 [Babjeviella inositovora NRRL Y-12698]ODQ80511.1 hypothetical protein BABINDRAFT_160784 [Babjeviella inositovora NRRL Y-12698]